MLVHRFALIAGIIYLAVGALGFVPTLVQPAVEARELTVAAGYGRLLGIFPINAMHNVVHLLIGFSGVLGLMPARDTLFGLAPLYSHDVWLHAGTATVAAYFGFGPPARHE